MGYKRILLKISGEWLANRSKKLSIDHKAIEVIGNQIKTLINDYNVQVAIVVGGGNFWRGSSAEKNGIPRSKADYIGMLATTMNALALQSTFNEMGIKTRVQSSFVVDQKIAEPFILEKTNKYLENNEVVILSGGTGRPYFTTDTAATLLASEIKADVLMLGKNNVNGVYDSDPKENPNAKHFKTISFDSILSKRLEVMDSTAVAMARDNNLELLVFNIGEKNSIVNTILGNGIFTKVVRK